MISLETKKEVNKNKQNQKQKEWFQLHLIVHEIDIFMYTLETYGTQKSLNIEIEVNTMVESKVYSIIILNEN